jgi:hypothetical protein
LQGFDGQRDKERYGCQGHEHKEDNHDGYANTQPPDEFGFFTDFHEVFS